MHDRSATVAEVSVSLTQTRDGSNGVIRRDRLERAANQDTFTFADNLWYCEDRPDRGRPELPTRETNGVYDVDPQLAEQDGWLLPQAAQARGFGLRVHESHENTKDRRVAELGEMEDA